MTGKQNMLKKIHKAGDQLTEGQMTKSKVGLSGDIPLRTGSRVCLRIKPDIKDAELGMTAVWTASR